MVLVSVSFPMDSRIIMSPGAKEFCRCNKSFLMEEYINMEILRRCESLTSKVLTVVLVLVGFFSLFSRSVSAQALYPDWYDIDWTQRKIIDITSSTAQIPSTLSDFPFTLILNNDAELRDYALSDGSDILFLRNNSEVLDYEIEEYNSLTGTLVAHILFPSISAGDTLYMYFGNPSPDFIVTPTNVWGTDHLGVWHMQTPTGSVPDSSINSRDGTEHNGVIRSNSGAIGNSYYFDGVDDYVSTVPFTWSAMPEYSLCVWFNPSSFPAYPYRQVVVGAYPHEFSLLLEDTDINFNNGYWAWSEGNLVVDQWAYYCVTFSNPADNATTYVNGDLFRSYTVTGNSSDHASDPNLDFGSGYGWTWYVRSYFNGYIDEIRLLSRALSEDEVTSLYYNQSNTADFYNIGDYQELRFLITDLDSTLTAVNTSHWLEDVTSVGQLGLVNVGLLKDYLPIADLDVDFDWDKSWMDLVADTDGSKSVFHYPSGYSSLPGVTGDGFALYAQRGDSDTVYVCPGAQTLEEVNDQCEGIYGLQESDSNVEIFDFDGTEYWRVSGLTGSGIMDGEGVVLAETGEKTVYVAGLYLFLLGGFLLFLPKPKHLLNPLY